MKELIKQRIAEESENPETGLWMSFCNDTGFLGVIITKSRGLATAMTKAHELGINPGGEIQSCETDLTDINPEHLDRLMSRQDLKEAGYI